MAVKEDTMQSKMTVGALCLMGAAALAACQPSPSPEPAATVAQSSTIQAPTPAARAATPNAAPKKALTIAGAKTPDAVKGTAPNATTAQNDEASISTTVTGCLMQDDGMFQLKDTEGNHAPKARSWKSGFIKKGSARIDVIDGANRLKMGPHVGYRVSVSGTLTDREMHARSMRATSERCD